MTPDVIAHDLRLLANTLAERRPSSAIERAEAEAGALLLELHDAGTAPYADTLRRCVVRGERHDPRTVWREALEHYLPRLRPAWSRERWQIATSERAVASSALMTLAASLTTPEPKP